MKLSQKLTQKAKLNQTLRNWLPLLQISSDKLKQEINKLLEDNPFAIVEQKKPNDFNKISDYSDTCIYKPSLYESIFAQINAPLFKTKKEQDIANAITQCISDEGYFEYDEKILQNFNDDEIEKIRQKFRFLEPIGIGSKDYKENFLWQLDEICKPCKICNLAKILVNNLDNLSLYTKENDYESALNLIRKLKNPPAIEFLHQESCIQPDLIVNVKDGKIDIKINDDFYPQILIDTDGIDDKMEFVSYYIKQAKDLIDALEMRKVTLYKIGLMIIEYQYDYFFGGVIKPMRLKDIANDLNRSASTISRAISNKFLLSSKGIMPLKSFFTTEVGKEDVSNASLKEFIKNLIKNENHTKPFSDEMILQALQKEFGIVLVRRTITKYRKILNIASSNERKKLYAITKA